MAAKLLILGLLGVMLVGGIMAVAVRGYFAYLETRTEEQTERERMEHKERTALFDDEDL